MTTSPAGLAYVDALEVCPNCGADSHCSRHCDYRGDWGEGDEVVTCNDCNTTYGHAVAVGYIVEQWKVGT